MTDFMFITQKSILYEYKLSSALYFSYLKCSNVSFVTSNFHLTHN